MKTYRLLILLILVFAPIFACTSFILEQGGSFYLAKNLDWEIDRGYLYYNLAGIKKTSLADPEFEWTSTYKSITNNQFGKEFPLGGLNEAGLAIEEMNSYRQGYEYDENKFKLNEFQWVQYQLDNSASVQDVIESFDFLTIKHALIDLHYIVTDKTGNVAVVECLKDGIKVYYGDELPYKVLSNNNYIQSVKYLGHFDGYGGDLPIRPDLSSQGRFVTAVSMLDTLNENDDAETYCFNILNTIKQWDTRWQFVYNPVELKITCKTHCRSEYFKIGFDELDKFKHNQFAITLYGGKHQRITMNAVKNREHLKYIQDQLKEYFPGKEQVYELMMEAGKKSLKQK